MTKIIKKWNDKEFPIREVTDKNGQTLKVADFELWAAIEDAVNYKSEEKHDEATALDNEIFFYCDSSFIASDPTDEEIINYLKENAADFES